MSYKAETLLFIKADCLEHFKRLKREEFINYFPVLLTTDVTATSSPPATSTVTGHTWNFRFFEFRGISSDGKMRYFALSSKELDMLDAVKQ